jgi:heptosyltransferase I
MRLSAIGDVTHVVPVIRAIRQHRPEATITWIIGKLEARLLSGLSDVEFIVFDKKGGLAEARQLRRTLKGRKFDVLLHMQVAARANLLSKLVKAPVRIGWDKPRWRDRHRLSTSLSEVFLCSTRSMHSWSLPGRLMCQSIDLSGICP